MEIKYINQEGLDRLKGNVLNNIEKEYYSRDSAWLNEYLTDDFIGDTGIYVNDIELVIPEKQGTETDLENCKRIYNAMKNLSIQTATEERVWAYLTHNVFWDYMRKRWPVEDANPQESFIKMRYLFSKSMGQALLRNGISRLWWIAYSTYDESYDNPYHLTEILLRDSDFQVGILERNFSRNQDLTRNLLKAIDKYTHDNKFPSRQQSRDLIKHINLIGGTKVLDVLDYEDIEEIILRILYKDSETESAI